MASDSQANAKRKHRATKRLIAHAERKHNGTLPVTKRSAARKATAAKAGKAKAK